MHRYKSYNGAMVTTAAQPKVTTGTSIKTMLQLATPSTRQISLISWGYSLDAVPGGIGEVELLQTDVAATVTAHVAAGVQPLDPNAPASLLTLGTGATGYTSSAEGTTTASRMFDARNIPATAGADDLCYGYQWVYDERPIVAVSKFVRVRVTFAAAVSMTCWITWEE